MLYAIIGALVVILDQWVKYWSADTIIFNTGLKELIPGVISLVNIHNDGAAFSLLAGGGARIYFIVLTAVFTLAVIFALATRFISGKWARWCLVLVTAGGVSNCIDRIIYGYVQDMFKVELFNFAVFNVADIFITVFAILFALAMLFEKEPQFDDIDQEIFKEDAEAEEQPRRRAKEEKEARKSAAAKEEAAREFFKKDAPTAETEPEKKKRKFGRSPKEESAEKQETPAEEKASRKQRRARYEEEYEQYKARRAARQEADPSVAAVVAQQKAAPTRVKPADPFAEWEKASTKPQEEPAEKAAAKLKEDDAFQLNVPEAPKSAAAPAAETQPAVSEEKESSAAPAASASFDLDDILSEFK